VDASGRASTGKTRRYKATLLTERVWGVYEAWARTKSANSRELVVACVERTACMI
jgi:hypothetical protein